MNGRRAGALVGAAVLACSCGSNDGLGQPYGLRDVETAFREHHVDTGPFGDLIGPKPLLKEPLKRGVAVSIAWGHPVSVAVFSSERGAAERAAFGRNLSGGPAPPLQIRKANVVVVVDTESAKPGELTRVRAALAGLD